MWKLVDAAETGVTGPRVYAHFDPSPRPQVEHPPQALGGLGSQEMVDGETAYATGFCGQALLQKDNQGQPAFVHRVLSKYNLMNLLNDATWRWVAPADSVQGESGSIVESGSGAGLIQRNWCIEMTRPLLQQDGGATAAYAPAPPLIRAIATKVISARLAMASHF